MNFAHFADFPNPARIVGLKTRFSKPMVDNTIPIDPSLAQKVRARDPSDHEHEIVAHRREPGHDVVDLLTFLRAQEELPS